MILAAASAALAQLGDPRFRAVLARGVLLALALLAALSAALWGLLAWALPDAFSLPWLGEVAWLDDALSWAALPVLLVLSVLLMPAVAAAMTSLFLDDVADAVESRHYPPPGTPLPWGRALRESLSLLGLALLLNLGALILSLILVPLAPLILVLVNGALLGREYLRLAALRHDPPEAVRALMRRHRPTILLAGCLVALPLLVPLLGILVPTLGAATFTHLYHRLRRR